MKWLLCMGATNFLACWLTLSLSCVNFRCGNVQLLAYCRSGVWFRDLYFSWEVILKDKGANTLSFMTWLSCFQYAGTLTRALLPSRRFSPRFLSYLLWKNQQFFCPCCVDTVILKALNLHGFVEIRGPSFTSTSENWVFTIQRCCLPHFFFSELGSRLSHKRIDTGVLEVPGCVQLVLFEWPSWSLRRGHEEQLREP